MIPFYERLKQQTNEMEIKARSQNQTMREIKANYVSHIGDICIREGAYSKQMQQYEDIKVK